MRAGNDISCAPRANANDGATELTDVIIFRRGPDGQLEEQVKAGKATLVNRRWQLDERDHLLTRTTLSPTVSTATGVLRQHAPGPCGQALRRTIRDEHS
jgi:hypothetical protein